MINVSRNLDLTIKPIPSRSPVLPHTVAHLGGHIDTFRPTYTLLKDNEQIIIQAPPLDPEATKYPSQWDVDYNKLHLAYFRYLAIIEDLLSTIEFGGSYFAHLTEDSYGEYQIIPDPKGLKQVACPAWGPRISLDDVQITVWNGIFDRNRGIWKGKRVDIFYAVHDYDRFDLNRAMYAYRRLEGTGCDLTFEFYGHLVDKNGAIVGLVTEAAWGRNIRLGDEELVAESLKRLTDSGCLYRAVWSNQFLVCEGKLRLLEISNIVPYKDLDALKKEAEFQHTWAMDELFEEFRNYGPYGHLKIPPYMLTINPLYVKYLRMLPTPERPLDGNSMYFRMLYQIGIMFSTRFKDDEKPFAPKVTRYRRKRDVTEDEQDSGRLVVPSRTPKRPSIRLRGALLHPYLHRAAVLQELSSTEGTVTTFKDMWNMQGRKTLQELSSTECTASIVEVVDE